MSFYRFIYESINGDQMSKAHRLYQNGQYEECINYINSISLVRGDNAFMDYGRVAIEPMSINLEKEWLKANCYYNLGKYNLCMQRLNYLIQHPSDDSSVRSFKNKATSLQSKVMEAMNSHPEIEVKYPVNTFVEVFSNLSTAGQNDAVEVNYEGLDKKFGCYYLRTTLKKKSLNRNITIYIYPQSDKEWIMFGYIKPLEDILKINEDDPIRYRSIIRKLPLLQKMMNDGRDGASSVCSLFYMADLAKPCNERDTPVIGLRCTSTPVIKNVNDLFNIGAQKIVEVADAIIQELQDNQLTTADKCLIYGEAMLLGAISGVISREFGRDVSKAFSTISTEIMRKMQKV